jgi:hypothetical protein
VNRDTKKDQFIPELIIVTELGKRRPTINKSRKQLKSLEKTSSPHQMYGSDGAGFNS